MAVETAFTHYPVAWKVLRRRFLIRLAGVVCFFVLGIGVGFPLARLTRSDAPALVIAVTCMLIFAGGQIAVMQWRCRRDAGTDFSSRQICTEIRLPDDASIAICRCFPEMSATGRRTNLASGPCHLDRLAVGDLQYVPMHRVSRVISFASLLALASGALITGCGSDASTQPSMADRQEDALRDPFGYSPHIDQDRDISGGGLTDFDRSAFKKDTNDVLNP